MFDAKHCYPCDEPVYDQEPPCPNQCKTKNCPSFKSKYVPDLSNKIIIWLYGGPGVGKGTQCKLLAQRYGLVHLSIGDLLREEIKTECTRAKCLLSVMNRGELVPNDHVLDLLKKAMLKTANTAKGYVIDGFPREERQGWQFEKYICPLSLIFYFHASDETLRERLLARGNPSNKICDNSDTLTIKLFKFRQRHRSIVDQYPHRLIVIDAERPTEAIFQDVVKVMDEMLSKREIRLKAEKAKKEREEKERIPDFPAPHPSAFYKPSTDSK